VRSAGRRHNVFQKNNAEDLQGLLASDLRKAQAGIGPFLRPRRTPL